MRLNLHYLQSCWTGDRTHVAVSVGLSSCGRQDGCPLEAGIGCGCFRAPVEGGPKWRRQTVVIWSASFSVGITGRWQQDRNLGSCYWTCRCTWILDTSNWKPQVQRVHGHFLARGVKALPLEVVRGDDVLVSLAPWCLCLGCPGPAVLPGRLMGSCAWKVFEACAR